MKKYPLTLLVLYAFAALSIAGIIVASAFAHPQSDCSNMVCEYKEVEDRNGHKRSVYVCE